MEVERTALELQDEAFNVREKCQGKKAEKLVIKDFSCGVILLLIVVSVSYLFQQLSELVEIPFQERLQL